jgi:hypothetical protein
VTTVQTEAPVTPLSLRARTLGVLTSPRATFASVAAHPRSLGILVLSAGLLASASYGLLSTEVGRLALVDQQVRTQEAFGRTMDDRMYAQLERMSGFAAPITAVTTVVLVPVAAAAVAGLLYGVFNALLGGTASYRQVLAVVAHTGVIVALKQLFSAPLNYMSESLASPTRLGIFFPMFDEASPAARFLGIIDLFVIWWLVVLAIGLSVLFGRPTRQVAWSLIGVYVGIALVVAGVMAMSGGT